VSEDGGDEDGEEPTLFEQEAEVGVDTHEHQHTSDEEGHIQ